MSADQRLDALQQLLERVDTTLADVLGRAERRDDAMSGAAEAAALSLAELQDALTQLKPDFTQLVAAIKGLKLQVNVPQVPVALTVQHQHPPAPERAVTYEVVIPGRHGASDQRMTITRTERATK